MPPVDVPRRPPPARLTAILARAARKAVVFRRGPSRSVLLLSWDLDTDVLTPGQWFRGRIYERRCDLSPDGEMLVYFAGYRGRYRSWTAVSRPPYLTALAFWPKGDGWGGGGLFSTSRSLALNHRPPLSEHSRGVEGDEMRLAPECDPLPKGFRIRPLGPGSGWGEDDPIHATRQHRDGWRLASEGSDGEEAPRDFTAPPPPVWIKFERPWVMQKPIRKDGPFLQTALHGIKERDGRWYIETARVVAGDRVLADLGRIDWADVDASGDVLYAQAGKLFRLRIAPGKAPSDPVMVADLGPLTFERRASPPEARIWPDSARNGNIG